MAFEIKNKDDFGSKGFEQGDMHFEFPMGSMSGQRWSFEGIRMSYSEGTYKQPIELDWKGTAERIIMHFNLQGRISLINVDSNQCFDHYFKRAICCKAIGQAVKNYSYC